MSTGRAAEHGMRCRSNLLHAPRVPGVQNSTHDAHIHSAMMGLDSQRLAVIDNWISDVSKTTEEQIKDVKVKMIYRIVKLA